MNKGKQFAKYSNYYDLIYKDKDYQKESDFILNILKRYSKIKNESLLSLGCGTGTYEVILTKEFKKIVGVDISKEMIKIAHKKTIELKTKNLKFIVGDAKGVRIKQKFDSAMAMFNIAGYQTTNDDFEKFLKTASSHLRKHGLFFFDAWYQPAVLKNRPIDKRREIRVDDHSSIVRKTTQVLDVEKSLLNINFEVEEVVDDRTIRSVQETHPMRFFTYKEIEYFLEKAGLKLIKICKFMDLDKAISEDEWNMFVVARKI